VEKKKLVFHCVPHMSSVPDVLAMVVLERDALEPLVRQANRRIVCQHDLTLRGPLDPGIAGNRLAVLDKTCVFHIDTSN
jgi:hypothetical protein